MSGVFAAHPPFPGVAIPEGVDVVAVPIGVGVLTGLHAVPDGPVRGRVLLVPGYTGSKEDFAPVLPALAAAGWEVLAITQRGQADSVAPVGVEQYALDAMACDVVEVLRLFGDGEPVHLLGHSLGGVIVRSAAIVAPASLASLTLLCSGPRGWPGRHAQTEALAAGAGTLAIWERDNPHTVGRADAELPAADAYLRRRMRATSDDNIVAGARILRDERDLTGELAEALRSAGVPALVAHGVWDAAWPIEWQRDMATRLGARYAVIPDAYHSPQAENPPATAALLADFWSAA